MRDKVYVCFWIILIMIFAFSLLFVIAKKSNSQELEDDMRWISRYQGTFGGCCGKDDCFKVKARILEELGDKVRIEVNGIPMTVPSKIVNVSQDENDYWCHLYPFIYEFGGGPKYTEEEAACIGKEISERCAHCIFIAVGM